MEGYFRYEITPQTRINVSFNIFPNSGHILHYGKLDSENVIIPKLAHQNIILPFFTPFHTSHDYLYSFLSCFFYHIFFHLSSNTLPGPICRRSGPLYLLYALVQVFSKSTQISHLVEVRHGLDFSPTSVILRSAGSIFCFLFSFSELY